MLTTNYWLLATIAMKPSISVIIPALNEEGNIAATVNEVLKAIGQRFPDHELLIFNDGSSDKTGEIADNLVAKNGHLKVIHNSQTMGLGYNYRKGVELAQHDFVILIPGDNEISGRSIEDMFDLVSTAVSLKIFPLLNVDKRHTL